MYFTLQLPAWPTRCSTQHQPAELLWGVLEFTCIIHFLFHGFKAWSMILMHARVDMCVCVCLRICVFVIHIVCICLWFWFWEQCHIHHICVSITHVFSNLYFGSSLPPVCFDNSAWETQTYSELLPLCLYFFIPTWIFLYAEVLLTGRVLCCF